MGVKVVVNQAGLAQVLRYPGTADAVEGLASAIKHGIDAQQLPVDSPGQDHPELTLTAHVFVETVDRAEGHVVIPHPAAIAMQAKHGVFTRAAAEAGVEVKS